MPEETPKPKTEPEDEVEDITDKDASAAKVQPAIFVNAYLVQTIVDGQMFRMTFGEGVANKRERIRASLVMPTEDIRSLVESLTKLLSQLDAEANDKAQPATGQ